MKLIIRLLAVIIVVPATYFVVYWIPCSMLFYSSSVLRFIVNHIVSLICAVIAGWYVWKKMVVAGSGLISSIIIGALILGGIGFSIGFFGPLIFSPGANQGPLLGIFITGPLGFLVGGIGGGIYWAVRKCNA
jgi:hypothetical protein